VVKLEVSQPDRELREVDCILSLCPAFQDLGGLPNTSLVLDVVVHIYYWDFSGVRAQLDSRDIRGSEIDL